MGRKKKAITERERGKLLRNKDTKYQDLPCKICGRMQYDVPGDVVKITCWLCVAREVGMPEELEPKSDPKPRGWHLRKEFVDKDGTVYHRGVEQPELFGTLKSSAVKPKIKKTKME